MDSATGLQRPYREKKRKASAAIVYAKAQNRTLYNPGALPPRLGLCPLEGKLQTNTAALLRNYFQQSKLTAQH